MGWLKYSKINCRGFVQKPVAPPDGSESSTGRVAASWGIYLLRVSDICRQVFVQRAITCSRELNAWRQEISQASHHAGWQQVRTWISWQPFPWSVLRGLTRSPDSVLQNQTPVPAWRSPRRNRINQPSSDGDRLYANDVPEKCVNMSSPDAYVGCKKCNLQCVWIILIVWLISCVS